jgi:peroxiredoxin
MKQTTIWILITLLVLAYAGTVLGDAKVGDEAPSFKTTTIDGRPFRSDTVTGEKAILVIFWATWCKHCKTVVAGLNRLHATYNAKEMTVLGINIGVRDSMRRINRFVKKYKVSYPVVFDQETRITKKFGILGVPTVVFVDKEGIIRLRSTGFRAELWKRVEKLIKPDQANPSKEPSKFPPNKTEAINQKEPGSPKQ